MSMRTCVLAGLALVLTGEAVAARPGQSGSLRPAPVTRRPAVPAPPPRAAQVPLVADDTEIPAIERDASPPPLGGAVPRCVRCVAPVWPVPIVEPWRFRLHLVIEATGRVATARIVQTLVGDPAARPAGTLGEVALPLRDTPSARAGLAAMAAARQWQFEPPAHAPMLVVTDVGADGGAQLSAPGAVEMTSSRSPLRIGGDIPPPRKLQDVPPVYPAEAIAARITGIVTIEARIGVTGDVEEARVVSGVPMLDEPALVAVRQWRYTPTVVKGVPVPVIMTVTVRFSLSR